VRDHRDKPGDKHDKPGDKHDDHKPYDRHDDGPNEAPPPPKAEQHEAAKAGYVWVDGNYQWKAGKYEWLAGHWEREQANKHWSPGAWQKNGDRWAWHDGTWANGGGPAPTPPGPPGNDRPHDAPPPPRSEQHEAKKAGYVWVDGDWDWKAGKYEWTAGHWEREQAKKRWRPGKWEQRDGAWSHTAGDWEDDNGPPGPPPLPPGPVVRDHRKDWKIERPIVSNYWPAKGKAGTTITIHGENFPKGTIVVWDGKDVRGVKVSDNELKVTVPPDAATGMLAVRAGRGRDIAVGQFEVAASFDPVAEQKRIEEEARKKAEAAWADRQKALAKDRAAREAAVAQRHTERDNTREQRRAEREQEIRQKFANAFLADPNTQDELTLHAQRVADIERMSDVAEIKADGKLAVRIDVLRSRENDRHDQRMATLDAAFRAGGAK
jgi:hypothetical protein